MKPFWRRLTGRIVLIVFVLMVAASAVVALRDRRQYTTSSEQAYKAFLVGVELRNRLYFKEAAAQFEKALQLDSAFAMAYAELARISSGYYDDRQKARDWLSRALPFLPRLKDKERYIIAILQAELENDVGKEKQLREAFAAKYPDCLEVHEYLGQKFMRNMEFEKAIAEYEKVSKLDPNYLLAYNYLAYLHYFIGDFDAAIEFVKKYVYLAGDQANPHDSYGEILMHVGRYDEAIAQFNMANRIKPDLFFVLMHLGEAHAAIGRIRDALGYIESARAVAASEKQMISCDLAIVEAYVRNQEYQQPISLLETLVAQHRDVASAWAALGWCSLMMGDQSKARYCLNVLDSLEMSASNTQLGVEAPVGIRSIQLEKITLRGLVAAAAGDFNQALTDLQYAATALSLPWRLRPRLLLGDVYYKMGDYSKARDVYLANLRDNPNHAPTLLSLARLYETLRQPEKQKEILLRYLSVMSGADDDLAVVKKARAQLDRLLES